LTGSAGWIKLIVMKAIEMMVFDLDGTLIRSLDDLAASVNHALAVLGLSPLQAGIVATFVGDGTLMTVQRALNSAGQENMDLLMRAYNIFKEYYTAHCLDNTRLYPGVEETLRHFQGKALAVSTNKPHIFARQILEGLGVAHFFADIMGDGNSPHLKPHPWALESLMEKHRVKPEKTVMVGDGRNDILCARNAGTLCCAVGYGTTEPAVLREMKPDFFCETFTELTNLFK
jgi:phosphoglycolate phosphatase